ncbi:lipopolysaccharide assembly protein LapB [Paenalcaligenes hominis]|uniref:Lipopolysaccharide assembly protein B n=1 Tax=Paenalcaligenes hominis TaxID=643674 RepID=A0A1U9JYZ5_9BURK|nr:lipopolysaccharide assembly protein LapB [Paenalcaligenes hominis]AQS51023.1 lipopolysaccharide assembly protein LapB [Paenalcaligenes hominis]
MDFEPWWLIIVPVLFGLGWLAARFDFKQMLSESKQLPDSYFKGLNFLLNEEPDQAIDAFIEVAKLDPETTELHFALGSLFRRRGEMERAIRVHQSLLARTDLPEIERENAQFEIAQDFLKAGMLDRAEAAFEAVSQGRHAIAAVRALIHIYESGHDWPQAIATVKRLRHLVDEPVPQLIHYQCEQAETALKRREPQLEQAEQALNEAERAAKELGAKEGSRAATARIFMLRAQVAQLEQNLALQQFYLQEVLRVAPLYAGLIADQLMQCYEAQGLADQALRVLQKHYEQYPSVDVFTQVFKALRIHQGATAAWTFAREALHQYPSLLGLDRSLQLELQHPDNPEAAHVLGGDLTLLRTLVHKHTQRLDRYACQNCGFEAKHFYWQCPGCTHWETYAPKRLEEMQ